jgi:hypothetical protein
MAQLLVHAEPGDVITAADWNLVVDAINELLQAGQTTGIKLAAMLPLGTIDQPVKIGQLVQLTGQGFGFSIGQSKVIFTAPLQGGTQTVTVLRANMLEGSSDERLLFIMPPIPNIPQIGAPTTMRVNNGLAEDHRSVYVAPVVINLTGDIFVNWRADAAPNPNPNPLQSGVGKSAVFNYRLQAGTNLPATFTLSADIINATVAVPQGLVSSIEFRDDLDNLISSKQVEMGKSESRNIKVRIPEVPSTFASQSFSLKVTATSGSVTGTDQRTFTVGQQVQPPDPNIQVIQGTPVVFDVTSGDVDSNPANGRLEGATIKLKANKQMVIGFDVQLLQAGNYDITMQPKPGNTLTGWQRDVIDTQNPLPVGPNDQTSKFVQIGITANQGAVASGGFIFRIKRQGATNDWFKEFDVQLL